MNIVLKKISEIKPYKTNPRKNQNAISKVAASIKEFGFKVPVIIDSKSEIVCGHTRVEAAKTLNMKEVPCIIADDLSEKQIKAFRLADNKVSEYSEWDENLLSLELLNLEGLDMSVFGFEKELEETEKDLAENDKKKEKTLKDMELKTFEHHDYLVFVFDNQLDFLNACTAFGIEKVNSGYGETKKVGVGRVVTGRKLVEKL